MTSEKVRETREKVIKRKEKQKDLILELPQSFLILKLSGTWDFKYGKTQEKGKLTPKKYTQEHQINLLPYM